MIAFLKGKIHSFTQDSVILDVNGVGYRVYYNHSQPVRLQQELMLYTYQQFREDAQVLFGFVHPDELSLFEKLITVKGLGPKTAINMMTAAKYEEIISAIEKGEVSFLKKMPGIGAKTASQIILDLKGKLISSQDTETPNTNNQSLEDALDAFRALGYKNAEINLIIKPLKQSNCNTTDEYIKMGLQLMMKRKG